MRIPGLRTGMMKNPIGFAVRAALNDRSGRRTSTRTPRTKSASFSSGSTYNSHVFYPEASLKDVKEYSGDDMDEPEILLGEGIVWVKGDCTESRNSARRIASVTFGVPNNEDYLIVTRTKRKKDRRLLFGIEVEVDLDYVLEKENNKRMNNSNYYSEDNINNIYEDYCVYDYKKNNKLYENELNTIRSTFNRIRHHKTKINNAIDEIEKLNEEINHLKERAEEIKKSISGISFWGFKRKRILKNDLIQINQEIEVRERIKKDELVNSFEFTSLQEKEEYLNLLKDRISDLERYNTKSEDIVINKVYEEKLYFKLLDNNVLSFLLDDHKKKEVLLKDNRISQFLYGHQEEM